MTPALDAALSAARADPAVAAVLDGRDAAVETAAPWGGTAGQPDGYTIVFGWSAAEAAEIDGQLPLLRADSAAPQAPYDSTEYRVRARDVTALRVDVLLATSEVLQVQADRRRDEVRAR